MDYWAETMQDDATSSPPTAGRAPSRGSHQDKDKKRKEQPDYKMGKQRFKST